MSKRITEHRVRNLKPRAKRYSLSEDGLLVEVFPSGLVSLYAKYSQAGVQVKTKIGDHPQTSIREARERVRELQLEATHRSAPKSATISFQEFTDGDFSEWVLSHRRTGRAALERARHQFYPSFGNVRLKDITSQEIERYVARAARHHAPATIKSNLSLLKRIFNLAVQWGYLRVNPAAGVKSPTVDSEGTKLYLSGTEFARLKTAIDRWEYLSYFGTGMERRLHPQWFVVWIKVVLNTGARRGESLKLRWADIDTEERTIKFTGAHTKNARTRIIPISDSLTEALRSYAPDTEDGNVFPVSSVKKPWERLMVLSGLDITPHTLRHHVASTLVLRGAPLSVVRDLLGHHDISVTTRYLSVRQEDKLEALNLL